MRGLQMRAIGAALVVAMAAGCGFTRHETFEPSLAPTPTPPEPDTSVLAFGEASAAGYVRDEQGRPIYPALVLPDHGGVEIALGTAPDGFYSLDGYYLIPGHYKLLVKADGYKDLEVEVNLLGQMRKRLDFTLIRE